MERLKGGVFLNTKDVQVLTGKSYKNSNKELIAVRDALGKKSNRITVKEYCDYYEINYEEIVVFLNQHR